MPWNIDRFDPSTFKEFAKRLQAHLKTQTPSVELPLHALHEAMAKTLRYGSWHEAEIALGQGRSLAGPLPSAAAPPAAAAVRPSSADSSWVAPVVQETTDLFRALSLHSDLNGSARNSTNWNPAAPSGQDWPGLMVRGPEAVMAALAEWVPVIQDPFKADGDAPSARQELEAALPLALIERVLDRAPVSDRASWAEAAQKALFCTTDATKEWREAGRMGHGVYRDFTGRLSLKVAQIMGHDQANTLQKGDEALALVGIKGPRGVFSSLSKTPLEFAWDCQGAEGVVRLSARFDSFKDYPNTVVDLARLWFRTGNPVFAEVMENALSRSPGWVLPYVEEAWISAVKFGRDVPEYLAARQRALVQALEKNEGCAPTTKTLQEYMPLLLVRIMRWGTPEELETIWAHYQDPKLWDRAFIGALSQSGYDSLVGTGAVLRSTENLRALSSVGCACPPEAWPPMMLPSGKDCFPTATVGCCVRCCLTTRCRPTIVFGWRCSRNA